MTATIPSEEGYEQACGEGNNRRGDARNTLPGRGFQNPDRPASGLIACATNYPRKVYRESTYRGRLIFATALRNDESLVMNQIPKEPSP